MRLVITENITLDGVVEQNEQTGEWFNVASGGADTSDVDEALRQMMSEEDAQLHGRKTFEAMRGFWPNQTDDTTGVADHLNSVDKFVISTTMDDPEWENSTVLSGPLIDEVRSLKQRPGSNLGVTGSISVCRSLIDAGMVDEYRLLLYPVVVGTGRRLFDGDGNATRQLRLVESKSFRSGIVLLRYQPA
ncbi:MAG: dihydrofolate reductase family protein [Ilumatobacteraceae bacterium]